MLPVELIREIIFRYVDDATPEKPTDLVHPSPSSRNQWFDVKPKAYWDSVSSLSLVSRVFRDITLEAWFQTFVVRRPKVHLTGLSTIPGVSQWTRVVHWINPTSFSEGLSLGHFSFKRSLMAFVRLRKLRIAAFPSNHSIILLEMFEELPPTVVELELRYHAWPSPQQLVPTATLLPNLRVLEMHQERAWCSLCNTCNVLRLRDDPVTITYTNGDGLPKLYNRYLAPLLHLRTVRLSAAYTLYGSVGLQDLKTPWRGECGECTSLHLTDEAFVADWEAQNKEEPRPPSLRKVIWTFAPVEEEESSEEDTESDYVDDLTRLQERYWMELDHDSDDDSGWDSLGSGDEN